MRVSVVAGLILGVHAAVIGSVVMTQGCASSKGGAVSTEPAVVESAPAPQMPPSAAVIAHVSSATTAPHALSNVLSAVAIASKTVAAIVSKIAASALHAQKAAALTAHPPVAALSVVATVPSAVVTALPITAARVAPVHVTVVVISRLVVQVAQVRAALVTGVVVLMRRLVIASAANVAVER